MPRVSAKTRRHGFPDVHGDQRDHRRREIHSNPYPSQKETIVKRRRDFLTLSTTAVAAAGLALVGRPSPALAMPKEQRDRLNPQQVIDLMRKGNERFRAGVRVNRDFLREQQDRSTGQFPAAVILSCIDSRAPAEIVMDLGIGDVFNSRMAGNITNADVLGGLEFACQVAGAKVVLVLGHTACGAVAGAIANVTLGNLTGLLDRIRPAIGATTFAGERVSTNAEFVDAVARTNVQLTMAKIRSESPVLAALEQQGTIAIAGAMYDLRTAVVSFLAPHAS